MKKLLVGLLMSASLVGVADAATVVYTTNTIGNQEADFDSSLDIQRFDSSQFGGATLESMEITLFGTVSGAAGAENRGSSARTTTLTLAATVTLVNPVTNAALVVVIPAVNNTANLARYDGVQDYAGASGVSYNNLSGSLSNSASFTDPSVLALFSGTGSIATPFSVVGDSIATGGGNISSFFDTYGGGSAQVTYTYSLPAAVPEPATWAMMIGGFGLVGYGMRRKKVTLAIS